MRENGWSVWVLTYKYLVDRVLESIPYDNWILANKIASQIGEKTLTVSWIIKNHLINRYAEKKRFYPNQTTSFYYRRKKLVDASNKFASK